MTIHVTIGEAEKRLAELVAAAVRGEDVVLSTADAQQVRLSRMTTASGGDPDEIVRRRKAAFGMWRDAVTDDAALLGPSMTDEEVEERWQRKFGPAA